MRRLALAFAAFLVACSPPHRDAAVLNRGIAGDIKSLDPAFVQGNWESWVVGDMIVGLTTEDAHGRPVPGMAARWEVSPDGLTWTFHLRDAAWSDGAPVTAADFVAAWRRMLAPATAAPYAYNLWVLKNARAISAGRLPPTALGARATDGKTLVVTLANPTPYLPELMELPAAWPIPRHLWRKFGNDWARPRHFVGNGPYRLRQWVPGDGVTLVKNPRFYDAAHVAIETVHYAVVEDAQAGLREYRAGLLDTLSPFPVGQIGWIRAHMPRDLRIAPYLGVEYLALNLRRAPFGDARVREAVNLALDRAAITERIHGIGERPAYGIVPPGVAGYPGVSGFDFRTQPIAARLARAEALMRAAGYGPARVLHVTLATTTNRDNLHMAVAIQAMLARIHIDATIRATEAQVYLANLRQKNFDIAMASWIADADDAGDFLDLLRSGSGENYAGYRNPAYDALLDRAENTPDPASRGRRMADAETMALRDYAWVPLYFLVTHDLVKPYVKGWLANGRDINRTRWLSLGH